MPTLQNDLVVDKGRSSNFNFQMLKFGSLKNVPVESVITEIQHMKELQLANLYRDVATEVVVFKILAMLVLAILRVPEEILLKEGYWTSPSRKGLTDHPANQELNP
ncbi:hypothetical protein NC651_008344 [Populus alba x Populus x berolinensis]|nr:hypothetical protein NC651_008344 [Populus alba x Populus x berolinensis]